MAIKRYAHNLSHTETSTVNMGTCIPCNIVETFPGDSFKITAKDLTRMLPQVAPTMHDVFIGIDTYSVPLRQLCEKIGINWDDYLTGGEDGTAMIDFPTITVPDTGYEPGSLADFLCYPTNYMNPSTNQKVIVGAGLKLSAVNVLLYMHVINENYRDQNFLKKLDFSKYQEFLDGTYQFYNAAGEPIDFDLQRAGLFPYAWAKDYFGKAMATTQRGPQVTIPVSDNALLNPASAPVISESGFVLGGTSGLVGSSQGIFSEFSSGREWVLNIGGKSYTAVESNLGLFTFPVSTGSFVLGAPIEFTISTGSTVWKLTGVFAGSVSNKMVSINNCEFVRVSGGAGSLSGTTSNFFFNNVTSATVSRADLSGISADLQNATATSIIAFRLAARLQQFGEYLQDAGARAVEYTMKFFGVRVPDARIQRPIFHGSFRMPIIFSEVLQTSQTTDSSPLATLGGHGIAGGVNRPIHIKCIEHGFLISIMHIMPRSQFQNVIPKYLLRKNRMDIPNPLFQGIGEQAIKTVELYPNTTDVNKNFGYVPQYSELMSIPSTLHGHMKDTFLHWTMARVYDTEPVLSAAWRYEKPSTRSFAVQDEDQMQVCIGFEIKARRPFKNNQTPGIHVI